jgi:hypothetical protein
LDGNKWNRFVKRATLINDVDAPRLMEEPHMAEKRSKATTGGNVTTGGDRSERGRADDVSRPAPSEQAIAQRAYELYQQRGGGDGRDLDDWLQAEEEMRRR